MLLWNWHSHSSTEVLQYGSVSHSHAYFHSLDIFHLISINPLFMLKGQLEHRVGEHSEDSLHFLFIIPLSLPLIYSSSPSIKQASQL